MLHCWSGIGNFIPPFSCFSFYISCRMSHSFFIFHSRFPVTHFRVPFFKPFHDKNEMFLLFFDLINQLCNISDFLLLWHLNWVVTWQLFGLHKWKSSTVHVWTNWGQGKKMSSYSLVLNVQWNGYFWWKKIVQPFFHKEFSKITFHITLPISLMK